MNEETNSCYEDHLSFAKIHKKTLPKVRAGKGINWVRIASHPGSPILSWRGERAMWHFEATD